jgi:uncharacterized protein YycO
MCISNLSFAQQKPVLQKGDFLFLDLECGGLCDAIEAVTEGASGKDFSHLGMVCSQGDSLMVLEAIGNSVRLSRISSFLSYTTKPALLARLKPAFQNLIPLAESFGLSMLGMPYDDAFLPENGKYYCSELVYDAFKKANSGRPFFQNSPMTFRKPGSQAYFPVWVEYYQKLGIEIPEGQLGCNPGGISRAPELEILGNYP